MVIIPHRGDFVWLDFEPQLGREIKKKRPALILYFKLISISIKTSSNLIFLSKTLTCITLTCIL